MVGQKKIVAVNGSPHGGVGNTAQMIEMLRPTLEQEGFALEVIHLISHTIEYCKGCAFCLEKGNCWIDDDHRPITGKLLAADGIILACPVYFFHVPGQMKTFIDRSLPLGHKPRPTWKPGLAICVSAGLGETDTANYLAFLLRTFGAFSVGTLTAIAVQPGGFIGRQAVEARAVDLARDLARNIQEKRRYPATDRDLRYYQFMSGLVKSQKDVVMKNDDQHWREQGLYESFEAYIQQTATQVSFDSQMRDAWIKEMIEEYKEKKGQKPRAKKETTPPEISPSNTCEELLRMMPLGFRAAAAGDLKAIYQFAVSGHDNFVAHLRIADGSCTYHLGPAEKPDIIIKTPAEVWLKISRGELNGQKAFMEGKYTVQGDMALLLRLPILFGGQEVQRKE